MPWHFTWLLLEGFIMARTPKPWWREDRQAWFVTIRGERHNLGSDKAAADREFHRLMSQPPAERPHCQSRRPAFPSPRSSRNFSTGASSTGPVGPTIGISSTSKASSIRSTSRQNLPAASLKPFHVVEWADKHPSWGANYRRGAIIAIQRPFNWAAKLGYIHESPIRYIEKPQPTRREQVISEKEWQAIRDHYQVGDPFRELLEFAWETGCRPQEAKNIEARHVDLEKHRVVFPPAEAKGKKRWRIIYLTPRAEEIIKAKTCGSCEGASVPECQGTKVDVLLDGLPFYAFENASWHPLRLLFAPPRLCHAKAGSGLDHITVAALMGHADATMLARVYSHIGEREDHLREQLNRGST